MAARTRSLVAFAHVADVERSVRFYADLGFSVANRVVPAGQTTPVWAWLESEKANLMVPGGECRLEDPDGYVLMLAQI